MAAVLIITVEKQEKDIGLVLTMTVSVMVALAGLTLLKPVLAFLHQLEELGDLQAGVLNILLKATGIGLVSELGAGICRDGGNTALAQAVKTLGVMTILSLSLPILETLVALIQTVLGEL